MFTDLFGGAPHAKVFDFLAEELDRDHTIMEISRGADVARPTVYKVLDDFTDKDIVEETRTLGNSRFFQLNEDNQTVNSLLQVVKPAEFADFTVAAEPGQTSSEPRSGRSPRRQQR